MHKYQQKIRRITISKYEATMFVDTVIYGIRCNDYGAVTISKTLIVGDIISIVYDFENKYRYIKRITTINGVPTKYYKPKIIYKSAIKEKIE